MADRFNFRPVSPNFSKRFPDGDYTVGRGADPRGAAGRAADKAAKAPAAKPAEPRRTKKIRPAAE
jgi:hypothetical protein